MSGISVVIPTMNRLESLKRTLLTLMDGTVLPDEIIIIDQTDNLKMREDTKQFVSTLPVYTYYVYLEQPSLTKARNEGMNYVSNEYVIQMDDDVDVKRNTLENLIDIFSDNRIALVAGINENDSPGTSLTGYLFGKKSYLKRNIGHVTLSMYGRFPIKISGDVNTEWAMGFFFAIRKSLFNKWNLKWDENLIGYAYAEDLDFSYQYYLNAIENDLKCIMSEKIIVKHNVSTEWRLIPRKHTFMIVLHREYLSYKFYKNPLARLATRWSNFGEFLRRFLKKENPKDVLEAQILCDRYRRDIKKGIFHYEMFM